MAIKCWCSKIFSKQCGETFGILQNPCWYNGKIKWEWVKTCQNPGSPVFPRDVQQTVSSPHSNGAIGFDSSSNKSCHCKNSSVSWNFNSRVRRSSCLLLEWSQLQLKVSGWNLFAFRFTVSTPPMCKALALEGPASCHGHLDDVWVCQCGIWGASTLSFPSFAP
jgi:hypothetical protein